jgi:ectoine hydroxylase-related dioxygenase (phytanoyl-CoA dioxygenase family)
MTRLDPAAIDRFKADGAICVRNAFPARYLDLAAAGIDRNIEHPSPFFQRLSGDGESFLSDMWTRRYIKELEDVALESPAAYLAAQCLETNKVRLVQDTWFLKRPGTMERTPWHHDNVVLGPFCSIWVALDAIPREASLEFVRGSHKWDRLFMPKSFFEQTSEGDLESVERFYVEYHSRSGHRLDGNLFTQIPDIEADRRAYDIVGWDLEPGDCIVFHARTVHGSPGNTLDHDTRRFVTRWVDESAILAPYSGPVIDRLVDAGFTVDLQVGRPIRGDLFPLVSFEGQDLDGGTPAAV